MFIVSNNMWDKCGINILIPLQFQRYRYILNKNTKFDEKGACYYAKTKR